MAFEQIAVVAIFACLYSAFAGGLERTPVNGALIFVAFGFLLGPIGFEFLSNSIEVPELRLIAELSLALVLFVEASKVNFQTLARAAAIPQRLILIALPLVIGLGFVFGLMLLTSINLIGLAILATIVAPTDAALGKAVVTNQKVPPEIREGLNFESGLNDGVCVPVFLAFLTVASGKEAGASFSTILFDLFLQEIGIGALVGTAVAVLAGYSIQYSSRMGWVNESWVQIPLVATAIACFAGAQALHGSGFIAAFVGGLVFSIIAGKDTHKLAHAAEETGDALAMLTWIIFGVALVGQALPHITWNVLLYSVLSLTVIRMIPVVVALSGLGLTIGNRSFIGWFGPRGLATVVFAMMVLQSDLPDAKLIVATATCIVVLSIIAHGLSAWPIINAMFGTKKSKGQ